MNKLNKKGFTLTEMIVVIAIIGILAGVLIPTITGYISRANKSNDEQLAASMTDEIERYCIENDLKQDQLIGTDIRTILTAKGYNLVPSKDSWTYVYNAEKKVVELKDVKKGVLAWSSTDSVDPTNYAEGMYLIGEGQNDFEQAIKLLVNYKNQNDYNQAIELCKDNKYKSLIEKFNPSTTLYIDNIRSLSTPTEAESIVFTVGTYNLPNLTNSNIVVKKDVTFNIPETITSINEYTKNKLTYVFSNLSEYENEENYPEIDLSGLKLSSDGKTAEFSFGNLVENTIQQTISIDVLGYVRTGWNDVNSDEIFNLGEEEIKLLYEVTVIYYDSEGITAKGTKTFLSEVVTLEYVESIKLAYSQIEYKG